MEISLDLFVSKIGGVKIITKYLRSQTKYTSNTELGKEQQIVVGFWRFFRDTWREFEKVCSNLSVCAHITQGNTPLMAECSSRVALHKTTQLFVGFIE